MADKSYLLTPVLVVERETGRLEFLRSVSDVRIFVEEFQDILEEEFEFWDNEARQIRFLPTFLSGDAAAWVAAGRDVSKLKRRLADYLQSSGASTTLRDELEGLLHDLEEGTTG